MGNKVKFFIAESKSDTDLGGNEITVVPSFPTIRETQENTAKSWSENHSRSYNSEKRCYEYAKPKEPIVAENRFNSLSIIDLECRGNGGRAYKVTLPVEGSNLLFDLREGPLLDMINTLGIKPGGCIEGEFEFVMNKSQLNLVRVGSSIWEEAKRMSEASKVPTTAYKVGSIYSDKSQKNFWIYLGAMLTKLEGSSKLEKVHVALETWSLKDTLLKPPTLLGDSGVCLRIKKSFTFYETEYTVPEDAYGEVSSYLKSVVENSRKTAEVIWDKYPQLLKSKSIYYDEMEFKDSAEAAALGGRLPSYWESYSSPVNKKWYDAENAWRESKNAQLIEAREEFGYGLSLWSSWDAPLVHMVEASSPIQAGGKVK